MYDDMEEVPDEPYAIPFGEAKLVRTGADATIVAIGRMVNYSAQAADALEKDGVKCDVIDLRTTSPLDTKSILSSVAKTGRLVVVDEASPRCNIATDISAWSHSGVRFAESTHQMVCPPHTQCRSRPDSKMPTSPAQPASRRPDGDCEVSEMSARLSALTIPKLGLTMKEAPWPHGTSKPGNCQCRTTGVDVETRK